MEITLEEIQKKFESLPEDLKWAIMAANVEDNIIEIGQNQGLKVEQMGQLSLATHMVMFGFTHPDKFEESVKNILKLPDEKTRALTNAVNEKILKEIRAKMIETSGGTAKVSETPKIPEEEKNDTQILDSAGIQIIPENDVSEKKLKEDVHGILAQKLSVPVQNPMVKTEHTMDNITKTTTSNPYPPKGDPYRLPPE
ncbi:MAG: hypothetical protein WC870_00775 [Candidatus Paceibacterota bacterium]